MPASEQVYLAVDLGASSGRTVAGIFDGQRISLEDVNRFDNGPVTVAGNMHWDLLRLWSSIQDGLRAAAAQYGNAVVSVGVDTWGVDYGLLGRDDTLLGNPYHYRDRRTAGMLETAFQTVSREEIFAETGLQFMELNTLFQMIAMRRANSQLLEMAECFLMMPDLFHWLMTGNKANEMTDASTTQFYNPRTKGWSTALFERFDLPAHIFGEIVQPGTRLGKLRPEVAEDTGLTGAQVVLPGTHDTASAVLAVPAATQTGGQPDWCYISSGTWSLMGLEVPEPIVTDRVRELNFTNEGGVGGTIRLLKNIAGLWSVQECRRIWKQAGRDFDWGQLVGLAEASRPLASLVNPDDGRFVAPKDMAQEIQDYCRETGQTVPQTEGDVIRCALESLAMRYREVLGFLEQLNGRRIETVHIVGGGTQNKLLSQMAADACNRRVVTGPVEATAIGNVMMQAVSAGAIGSIDEAREVISRSFDVEEFEPQNPAAWDEAYERYQAIVSG